MTLRLVLADDEGPARARLRRLLSVHPDLEVVAEAADGYQALELVQAHRPDVVLLDVSMPGPTGLEVASRLLESEGAPMILFVTASQDHAVQAFELRALDYLVKPVLADRLARALERVRATVASQSLAQERQRLRSRIDELLAENRTDALTQVPNRRALEERLAEEVERAARHLRPLSLAMLDMDHFKRINDTFGHAVGDLALQHLAGVVSACLRPSDFVARYGGEEFVVVLPESEMESAGRAAERLREAVAGTPLVTPEQTLSFTVSLGISQWRPGDSPQSLQERADQALYQAKSAGRNRVVRADS